MCVPGYEPGWLVGGSDSTIDSDAGETKACDGPVVLGYLRKHLLMTTTEVTQAKQRLTFFARHERLTLDRVYVEEIETWPAAFEALVQAAMNRPVKSVLLPSMVHFAILGPPAAVKEHFEYITNTRIVIVPQIVSYVPGEAVS